MPRGGGHPRLPFDPVAEARRQWENHGWSELALPMAVVTSVMRVQQIFLASADRVLRPLGLTFARYEVLMLLSFARTGTLPLGTIGERLQVKAASVTNAVDRLQADGLVERRPHPSDGRGVLAAITPQGRSLAERATEAMNRQVFDRLPMSTEEQRSLFHELRTLRAAAGDFPLSAADGRGDETTGHLGAGTAFGSGPGPGPEAAPPA